MDKHINFTKGFVDSNEQKTITVPMVKEYASNEPKAFGILSYNGQLKNIKLNALS